MNTLNRRELCIALSALAAVGGLSSEGEGQSRSNNVLSQSKTWTFDSLPMKHNSNGGASRAVVQGSLATGEAVEVHETTLPPGQMPHPAHKHRHSEFMFIREGSFFSSKNLFLTVVNAIILAIGLIVLVAGTYSSVVDIVSAVTGGPGEYFRLGIFLTI